jgi:hypothetical protein
VNATIAPAPGVDIKSLTRSSVFAIARTRFSKP